MDTFTAYALIAVAFAAGYVIDHRRTSATLPELLPPDAASLDADGKIAAIKAYRERTGVGLRDAKHAGDTLTPDV